MHISPQILLMGDLLEKCAFALFFVGFVILSDIIGFWWSVLVVLLLLAAFVFYICHTSDKEKKYNARLIDNHLVKKGISTKKIEYIGGFFIAIDDNRIWYAIINSKSKSITKDFIINDFSARNHICCFNIPSQKRYCIFIDQNREKLIILAVNLNTEEIEIKHFDFSSIVSVEQIKNGITIYKKSNSSTIGRALVGGVLAGGAGAVIGGTTGKQTGEDKCTSLITKIQLNDISEPTYELIWHKSSEGITNIEDSSTYKMAQKVLDTIKAIIATTEAVPKNDEKKASSSVADEIVKLHKLMSDNIISKEEFEQQKKRLLEQ